MVRRQRGATFLGMVIIIAIIGCGLYGGIRLTPLYFEYMAVVRAMQQTAKEEGGEGTSPQALRVALQKRWDIEDIHSVEVKEIAIVNNGGGFMMRAQYRAEAPFVSNVSLVVDFDKSVQVSGSGAAGG